MQSAFNQAYRYQEEEYREIFRRFCRKDSDDIDVREFQAACLSVTRPPISPVIDWAQARSRSRI